MEENKRIIEVNGIKMEVDLRNAKVIDHYQIGQMVKTLNKEYSNSYKISPAIITDFITVVNSEGEEEGAIQLLVLEESYSGVDLKFKVYGQATKDFSISPFNQYEMKWSETDVVSKFDVLIQKNKEELRVLETKRNAFQDLFVDALTK